MNAAIDACQAQDAAIDACRLVIPLRIPAEFTWNPQNPLVSRGISICLQRG